MDQKQEDIKEMNVHQLTITIEEMNLPGLEETLMTQPSYLPMIMLKLFLPEGDAQERGPTIRSLRSGCIHTVQKLVSAYITKEHIIIQYIRW